MRKMQLINSYGTKWAATDTLATGKDTRNGLPELRHAGLEHTNKANTKIILCYTGLGKSSLTRVGKKSAQDSI